MKIIKFIIGLLLLSGLFLFFASGITPPGIAGDVLRHNQANNIDASPLFYTDVDNMSEIEDSLKAHIDSVANLK